jgi:hypothetical protein
MLKLKTPFANPPAKNWRYDLSTPNDPPDIWPCLLMMPHPPNRVNDIFLELPREEIVNKGFAAYMAIPITILMTLLLITPIAYAILAAEMPSFILLFSALFGFGIGMRGAVYYWRIDMQSPVDNPIRFNRARRKVYVYRFHHSGWHLFSNTGWGIKPAACRWDDLHAEFCSTYGAMGTGGTIESVALAVIEPGTNNVIDRFIFAHDSPGAEMYWAMAQIFMQQGPQALPTFDKPPA